MHALIQMILSASKEEQNGSGDRNERCEFSCSSSSIRNYKRINTDSFVDITENSNENKKDGIKNSKVFSIKEDKSSKEKFLSNIYVEDLSLINNLALNSDVTDDSEKFSNVTDPSKNSMLALDTNIIKIENNFEIHPKSNLIEKRLNSQKEELLNDIRNYQKFINDIGDMINIFKVKMLDFVLGEIEIIKLTGKNRRTYHKKYSDIKYLQKFLVFLNQWEYMILQFQDNLNGYESEFSNETFNVDNLTDKFVNFKFFSFQNLITNIKKFQLLGWKNISEVTRIFYDDLHKKLFQSSVSNEINNS